MLFLMWFFREFCFSNIVFSSKFQDDRTPCKSYWLWRELDLTFFRALEGPQLDRRSRLEWSSSLEALFQVFCWFTEYLAATLMKLEEAPSWLDLSLFLVDIGQGSTERVFSLWDSKRFLGLIVSLGTQLIDAFRSIKTDEFCWGPCRLIDSCCTVLKFLSLRDGLAECFGLLNWFHLAIGAFWRVLADRVEWGRSLNEKEGAHWLNCIKLEVCFLLLFTALFGLYLSLLDIIEGFWMTENWELAWWEFLRAMKVDSTFLEVDLLDFFLLPELRCELGAFPLLMLRACLTFFLISFCTWSLWGGFCVTLPPFFSFLFAWIFS